jgi:hypothetical protein
MHRPCAPYFSPLLFGLLPLLLLGVCPKIFSQGTNLPPLKYEQPVSLPATIYDLTTTNLLYKSKRVATRSGNHLDVTCDYLYPNGRIAAKEILSYEGDQLISFSLEETQIGAKGAAKIVYGRTNGEPGKIEFEYQADNGKRQTSSERLRPDTLTGDMIGPFLIDHWNDLMNNKKIECRYLVIPRRETVGFTFLKQAETKWRDHPCVVVRMEATSWIISQLTDPLHFIVEKQSPHRIFQYTGRTTPKIRVKNDWQDLDAITIFDWQ